MDYQVSDLIDLVAFQKLLDSFYAISGLACTLVDNEKNVLAHVGWHGVCADFHRAVPEMDKLCRESDAYLAQHLEPGRFSAKRCLNGLWDYAIPIMLDTVQVGILYVGQFLHDKPDEEAFRQQARQFGLDEEAYIAALDSTPIVSPERAEKTIEFFTQLAHSLAVQGLERQRALHAKDEQAKAEKARQDVEAFYRQLVEKINAVIYLDSVDNVSSNLYTSPQIEKMLGYSRDEWVTNRELWVNSIHPDDRDRVMEENQRTNSSGEPFEVEYRLIARDGRVVWVRDQAVLTYDEDGKPWGWWGVLNDITAYKQAQETIRMDATRLDVLLKLSQMGNASDKEITDFVLNEAIRLTGSTIGYIAFISEDESVLHMSSWSKSALEECKIEDKALEYPVETTGLWGEAVRQRKAIITNDYAAPSPYKKGYPEGHVHIIRHMNVPIFDGERIVIVVGVGNKADEYTEADVQQLTLLLSAMWNIVQRKRAQETLQQRLVLLTSPVGDTSGLKLEDLFDIKEIQAIQDAFAEATGVASVITDTNGRPITTPSNFCSLCKDIIRKTEQGLENCMYSDAELGKVNPGGPIIQPCLSGGLWDAGTSIRVGEHHIANWLIGQVMDESQSEEKLLAYAHQIGADEDAYRKALKNVTRMSFEQFQKVAQALFIIAEQLSLLAMQNIQQARIISEKQRVEEILNQERILLRTLINNLPDAIYVKDAYGRKTLSNPSDLEFMGFTEEGQVLGKTDLELLAIGQGERTYADDMGILTSGQARINYEEQIESISGRRRWLLTSKIPLRDEKGNVVRLVGIGRDITEHRKALEALTNERNLMRALIENSPEQIFVKDRDSRFLLCNPSMVHIFGVKSVEEIIGKTDYDFHSPELAAEFYLREQRLMQTGQPIIGEEQRIVDADGNVRWVISTKAPWRSENGEVIGLIGINHDITERKKSEETITRERNLLRVLVEHIPDPIYVKDRQGRFVMLNTPTARGFNLTTPELVVGKTDFDLHPPDKASYFYEEEQTVLRSGIPLINEERWDVPAEGEPRWLSVTKVPWRNENGEIVGLVGINRDLTDRKQAEDEIRILNAELEQRVLERTAELVAANRELEDFAYSVSHDLRSPLRGIDGFSQALLEDNAAMLNEQGKHYLNRIRAASQRMGQIIDDLLKLSRVTRAGVQRVAVDLSEMAKNFFQEAQMAQPNRIVEVVIEPKLTVFADPNLIRMAFHSILENAWKFTAAHPSAHIQVGKKEQDGESVYFVRDDGIGFDMTYANKLFGTFQRLHSLTDYEGTGIGLAIVQRVVQRHGGRVWAQSEVDKGTTIFFTIP